MEAGLRSSVREGSGAEESGGWRTLMETGRLRDGARRQS